MTRKIIHIDMDAFYASVEQRNDPALRGLPIGVGGQGPRGVLTTASYEARKFGVKSAMPTSVARRLCPELIVVPPNFSAYRDASETIRGIFESHASAVEPLALDEAFLDVTEDLEFDELTQNRANKIRDEIFDTTGLNASAGVSYNKFLAKIASNLAKPNGCTVIKPHKALELIASLPIEAFFGVGPATAKKMHEAGIKTGADLQRANEAYLTARFGRMGAHYWQLAQGQDDRPVSVSRDRKSVSVEETYATDLVGRPQIQQEFNELIESLTRRIGKAGFRGQTITMKIRTRDFQQTTRSITSQRPIVNEAHIQELAETLLNKFDNLDKPMRLLGLGVSNQIDHQRAVQLELTLAGGSNHPNVTMDRRNSEL